MLLDFGRELHGGVQVMVPKTRGGDDGRASPSPAAVRRDLHNAS